MQLSNVEGRRGLWPRLLVLVCLLGLGATACGGSGDGGSAADSGATGGVAAEAQPTPDGQQPVSSSPLSAGQGPEAIVERALNGGTQVVPAPPPPDLGIGQPQAPPNTVSLEVLHQQGRTHVLP